MVYNREPQINDLPLKVCDNKLKLFFNGTTVITSIDMLDTPVHTFKFKPFVDFLNGDFDVDRLYATGKLNLSNAWNGSKLLLDYDHPQVVDFKAKPSFPHCDSKTPIAKCLRNLDDLAHK
ncbi:hypothetical protein RYX36_033463, partial [Vicia faba]